MYYSLMKIQDFNKYLSFIVLLILICFSAQSKELKFKIQESDSTYFQSIKSTSISPDSSMIVISQKSSNNRINILRLNGKVFKSYLIDDAISEKYIELINYINTDTVVNKLQYLEYYPEFKGSLYQNTVLFSEFLNDSVIVAIGSLKYLVKFDREEYDAQFKRKSVTVLLLININTDEFEVKPLIPNLEKKLMPYEKGLDVINQNIFFTILPYGFMRDTSNYSSFVLGNLKYNEKTWNPLLRLPIEYINTNINLDINYDYKINKFKNDIFFMAPLTNYLFNLKGDTIKPSNLNNPLEYTLKSFNSEKINIKDEKYKLDSLPHSIVDFFFTNDFLYVILNKPKNQDGKIYLNKYSISGDFISSKSLNQNNALECVGYCRNSKILYKVYMENSEWYFEEINFN